jgi:hypothetical protein
MGELEKLDHTLKNNETPQLESVCSTAIHKSRCTLYINNLIIYTGRKKKAPEILEVLYSFILSVSQSFSPTA